MARTLCVVLTIAHPADRALTRSERFTPTAFEAAHPALADAARRVLRTGTTEAHPGQAGASVYIARGVA